jgi:hypothetical protein
MMDGLIGRDSGRAAVLRSWAAQLDYIGNWAAKKETDPTTYARVGRSSRESVCDGS